MQANCVEDKCSDGVPLTRSWTPPPVDHRYQLAIPTPPLQRPLRGGSWGRVRPFVQPTCRSSLGLGNDFKVVDRGKKKSTGKFSYYLEFTFSVFLMMNTSSLNRSYPPPPPKGQTGLGFPASVAGPNLGKPQATSGGSRSIPRCPVINSY